MNNRSQDHSNHLTEEVTLGKLSRTLTMFWQTGVIQLGSGHMQSQSIKIHLADFKDIKTAVLKFKKPGVTGRQLYHRIVENAPVDLDMLAQVIQAERSS